MRKINSRFFIKNFLLLSLSMGIPLLVLGAASSMITKDFVEREINENNLKFLKLIKDNLELIFNESDSLNLNFGTNPEITVRLRKILSKPDSRISLEEYNILNTVKNFLGAPANSRPYIDSIYIYLDNPYQKFLTSSDGFVTLENYYDTSWYESYSKSTSSKFSWTEPRTFWRYKFEHQPNRVLTIYRRFNYGVIVLNIKASYIENLLKSLATTPDQTIAIIDENNQVIMKNRATPYLDDPGFIRSLKKDRSIANFSSEEGILAISLLDSERYQWRYISIIPQHILYTVPRKLHKLTLALILFSIILGLALTYWFSRKNYLRIKNIISIFNSIEQKAPLPPFPSQTNDEYDYITYQILKNFVEENYLQLQLSERKYKLQTMELLALQSQINPHFLFNTLETIKWKIIGLTIKPNETSKMVENLSDILKYSLDSPKNMVTLKEEINCARSYVDIQKVRYKDKFELYWEYDGDVLKVPIIRLIFQPLIENCIYHGIKEKEGKSDIKVKIRKGEFFLRISIIDNGMGIQREKLQEIIQNLSNDTNNQTNIGLYNTNKRLTLTYGEEAAIHIRSKFLFGTVIYFRVPIKTSLSMDNQISANIDRKDC